MIVTAELGAADLAWLDGLRRKHYPPERNQLAAHLTMFHAVAPSAETELRSRLAKLAAGSRPVASIAGVMNLGGGIALRVVSDDLDRLRRALAEDLHGLLGAQDSSGWRPHVTIQNKVSASVARDLMQLIEQDFEVKPLRIAGLGLHRYLGGSWEMLGSYRFRGV
ncbi:MAG: 2'-5' RNA ligase family protein [Sphingomicrobium sp.]